VRLRSTNDRTGALSVAIHFNDTPILHSNDVGNGRYDQRGQMRLPIVEGLLSCFAVACLATEISAQAPCSESAKGRPRVGVLIGFAPDMSADSSGLSDITAPASLPLTLPLHPDEQRVFREDTLEDGSRVRSANSTERADPLSTLWVFVCDNRVTTRAVQHIVIPRKDGFWRLGTNTAAAELIAYQDSNVHRPFAVENFFWLARLDETPRLRRIDAYHVTCASMSTTTALTYVGMSYVGHSTFGESACAHYDESSWTSVQSLDSIYAAGGKRPAGWESVALLGPSSAARQRRLNDAARSWTSDCGERGFESTPTNWTIKRERGSWIAVATFTGTGAGVCGRYNEERVLRVGLPRSIQTPQAPLPLTWRAITRAVPDAIDATASPDQSVIVVLSPSQVRPMRVERGKLQPLGEPVPVAGPWVMLEWARGAAALRWNEVVSRLPARPLK
jgi:hypothetical protein